MNSSNGNLIYLHYKDGTDMAFTASHRITASDTLDLIIDCFVVKNNKEIPNGGVIIDSSFLELRHEDGCMMILHGSDGPEDREDIFVVDCVTKRKVLSISTPTLSKPKQVAVASSSSSSIDETMIKLKKLFSNKSYAEARKLCETTMKQGDKRSKVVWSFYQC